MRFRLRMESGAWGALRAFGWRSAAPSEDAPTPPAVAGCHHVGRPCPARWTRLRLAGRPVPGNAGIPSVSLRQGLPTGIGHGGKRVGAFSPKANARIGCTAQPRWRNCTGGMPAVACRQNPAYGRGQVTGAVQYVGRLATGGSQPAVEVAALYRGEPAVARRQKPAYFPFSAARSSRRRRQCQRPWAFTSMSMRYRSRIVAASSPRPRRSRSAEQAA